MNNKLKTIGLEATEFLGLEFHTDYKRYFVFGTNPSDMVKRIIQMYNSYAGTKYTARTFSALCKEEEYHGFLYKFNIQTMFSFDDDCYSMGELGGTELGRLI